MSYLDRVNQEYWDFNEAASEFINKHHGSKEEGLTALSNELSFKKGQVAHLWKKNWKSMVKRFTETNKENEEPGSSEIKTSTVNNNYFNDQSQQNNYYNNHRDNSVSDSQGSFSSTDDTPTRTTKLVLSLKNDNDKRDDDLETVWIKNDYNLSHYLLHALRIKSIEHNNNKEHKELSLARRLSLFHVFYFPLDQGKSCICYLDTSLIKDVYQDVLKIVPAVNVPAEITTWAEELLEICENNKDVFQIDLKLSKYLNYAAEKKSVSLRAAVYTFLGIINHLTSNDVHSHPNAEDTFVHQIVAPFLTSVFQGDHLKAYWSNTQLEALSPSSPSTSATVTTATKRKYESKAFQPDFLLYAWLFGYRFDLFVVEIKPPKSSMAAYDFPKLVKEMKCMLGKLVELGIEAPSVCGLWINGYNCKSYILDIKYDGIYRLVQVGDFELPRSVEDVLKIRNIMKQLYKMKTVIDITTRKIEEAICRKKNGLQVTEAIASEDIPRPSWLRGSPGEEKRVKKTKKNI